MSTTLIRQRSCTLTVRLTPFDSPVIERPARPTHHPTKSSPMLLLPLYTMEPETRSDMMGMYNTPQHCQDMTLQKYNLLNEQHKELVQQLDASPDAVEMIPTPTTHLGVACSRPRRHQRTHQPLAAGREARRATAPIIQSRQHTRRVRTIGAGNNADTSEDSRASMNLEEAKLYNVNEGIKRTLTELLNCSDLRKDAAFRSWAQRRLMETEQELRCGRRRRSS